MAPPAAEAPPAPTPPQELAGDTPPPCSPVTAPASPDMPTSISGPIVRPNHADPRTGGGGTAAPQWLLDRIQVKTVASLEVTCSSMELYEALLEYAAHRAVDVDEPIPEPPAKIEESDVEDDSDDEFASDKENDEKKINDGKDGEKKEEIKEEVSKKERDEKNEKGKKKSGGEAAEKKDVKDDVSSASSDKAEKLAVSVAEAGLESDGSASEGIAALAEAAKETGDVQIVASSGDAGIVDEGSTENTEEGNQTTKKKKGASATREYPGRLSTLWNAPESTFRKPGSRGAKPNDPDFRMGLGFAKAEVDGEEVYVWHMSKGEPLSVMHSMRLFRCVVLFGVDPDKLRKFCRIALRWRFDRNERRCVAQPGRYLLYSLMVNSTGMGRWINHGHKKARSLKSIILPKGQLDAIIEDFKEFSEPGTKEWYVDHGLPHRRSYLFYGPPGVGKTSTIRALAGELKVATCFLCMSDRYFTNRTLMDALACIPKPSMLVLEDVDVLFNENRKSENPSTLTFSGLLNALDGLVSTDGVVTVMTTNHIERLDPALIRAGRVDRRFEFRPPARDQIADLFCSFYPEATPKTARKFADIVFSRPEKDARSIATLQQHFIYTRKKTAEECINMVPEFFEAFYPGGAHYGAQLLYA